MVTVQQAARPLLAAIGVTQLTPQPPGSELETLQPQNLDDAALCLTAAMQEMHQMQPLENMEQASGGFLNAPTPVTLTATQGSAAVSLTSGYDSWMKGCTIRIAGDSQDNQILTATGAGPYAGTLAVPYSGSSGSGISATVYGDFLALPPSASRAISPVTLPNQLPLVICENYEEFLRLAGYPLITDAGGCPIPSPFFYFIQKSVSRPRIVYAQGAYDSTMGYVPRGLRFAPMPDVAYPVGFRVAMTAPRWTRDDIVSPLTTLTVTGAGDSNANQTYTYLCDINGFRAFNGVTHPAYVIFYAPWNSCYTLASALGTTAPAAYYTANNATSPLGPYNNEGSATGTVNVATSDAGQGAGDPGTVIPIQDSYVESILIPMALQRFTATGSFNKDNSKAEILRQYKIALDALRNARAIGATRTASPR